MSDPDLQKKDPVNRGQQTGEPVVSKPYVMPDDPEPGGAEALAREASLARYWVSRSGPPGTVSSLRPR